MKRLIIFLMFVAIIGTFCTLNVGCDDNPEEAIAQQGRRNQRLVNDMVRDIVYIKDPRTGLCFAYKWGGAANGGPALAMVPCESIPEELLITAQIEDDQ